METILVDQDNTLSDFTEATVRFLKENYGYLGKFSNEDCVGYNILNSIYPDKSEQEKLSIFEHMFSHKNFWLGMLPIKDSIEVFERLSNVYDIYIVTSPWKTSKNCIPEKIQWVERHLPFFDTRKMIFCSHKNLLKADYMIDDSPAYLESSNCKITIGIDYPYNKDTKVDFRVSSWKSIEDILQ